MDRDLRVHLEAYGGYEAVGDVIDNSGHEVILVGRNSRLGTGLGPATRWVLVDELNHDGVNALAGSTLTAIGPHSVSVHSMEDGEEKEIPADTVVVCTGYRANEDSVEWLRMGAPGLRVIGDAKQIDHAMEGIAEAYDVAIAI